MNSSHISGHERVYEIAFRGEAEKDADDLRQQLENAGAAIGEPVRLPDREAAMGAIEIVLTVMLSAFVKTAMEIAFEQIRSYLKKKLAERRGGKDVLHFKVVMTIGDEEPIREPFSLRNATNEAIDKYIDNLSKTAVESVKLEK
jgi:hypothetical protein